ncbi:hypothetical protein [uncultured Bilophila sp.]|nr:hypothetical protein [uncultured Bilophila sp.]
MFDFHPLSADSANQYCDRWGFPGVRLCTEGLWLRPLGEGPLLFWFLLHRVPFADGVGMLRQRLEQGEAVGIIDYKLPERNLDFPAFWLGALVEKMGTHHEAYKRFMRYGGIEGLVRDVGRIPAKRDVLWGGGVGFIYWV